MEKKSDETWMGKKGTGEGVSPSFFSASWATGFVMFGELVYRTNFFLQVLKNHQSVHLKWCIFPAHSFPPFLLTEHYNLRSKSTGPVTHSLQSLFDGFSKTDQHTSRNGTGEAHSVSFKCALSLSLWEKNFTAEIWTDRREGESKRKGDMYQ